MSQRLWYLRRAVPWSAVSGCLALGVVLLGVTWWKNATVYAVLPLVALLAAAAAAFSFDDAASAVTRTTARGSRWAQSTRLVGAAALALLGLSLIAVAPGAFGRGDAWPLVTTALVLVATAASAWLVRRGHTSPGATTASTLVLAGLVPFVAARLLNATWPWPDPGLAEGVRTRWLVLGALAALALGWTIVRPLPRHVGASR